MAIKFTCPHCRFQMAVKEQLAGKKAICPSCQFPVVIPPLKPAPAGLKPLDPSRGGILSVVSAETANQTIEFNCPQCDEKVSVSATLGGKQDPCPHCRRIIKIPMPKAEQPGEWRRADRLPTGARRDTEPVPEGAWGTATHTQTVSRDALLEAQVIRSRKNLLSPQQKWVRRALVGGTIFLVLVTAWIVLDNWQRHRQEYLLRQAILGAATLENQNRDLAAEVYRGVGEFSQNTGQPEAAPQAKNHYNKARDLLARSSPGIARDLLLTELARTQLDLGGTGPDGDLGRLLPWEEVLKGVHQTLSHLTTSGGRLQALRLVCRRLRDQGQASAAVSLTFLMTASTREQTGTGDEGIWPQEAPELVSVVGEELFKAGHRLQAEKLWARASSFYVPGGEKNKPEGENSSLHLCAPYVALTLALGKPEPRTGREEDAGILQQGRVEGLALKGDLSGARVLAERVPAALKWRLFLFFASLGENDSGQFNADLEQANLLVENEFRGQLLPSWLLFQQVKDNLGRSSPERIQKLVERIPSPEIRGQGQVVLLQQQLRTHSGRAEESMLEGLAKLPWIEGMAREAFLRHNARQDASSIRVIETWPENMRPFGLVGAALGLQDRSRRK